MKRVKASLHKSGDVHIAFVENDKAETWQSKSGSRYLEELSTRPEFLPGWSRLLNIVHPESELRFFDELGL